MKLGTMGISVVVCTQDEGAPSDNNVDCSNKVKPVWPIYPSSSPYVTAVGATALLDPPSSTSSYFSADVTPICQKIACSKGTEEVTAMAPNAAFTSGGGFSDIASRPDYQDSAVTAWMNTQACRPADGKWASGGRAYPDISAVGENIYIVQGGDPQYNGGTSASTPIVSSVITLLNDWRLNHGKSPLGFLNPMLYQMAQAKPSAFNDIVKGNNTCTGWGKGDPCCPNAGYCATPGWDPATGLGTPNFGEMLEYVMSLP